MATVSMPVVNVSDTPDCANGLSTGLMGGRAAGRGAAGGFLWLDHTVQGKVWEQRAWGTGPHQMTSLLCPVRCFRCHTRRWEAITGSYVGRERIGFAF